jgi:hypothetical protein
VTFSLWMYPEGVRNDGTEHAEIIVMLREWSYGDARGVVFTDFWTHSDDREGSTLEDEVLSVFDNPLGVESLIRSGKLVRLGPAPSYLSRTRAWRSSPTLGAWA